MKTQSCEEMTAYLKSRCIWNANRQIREDGKELVCPDSTESEVMSDFMNSQKYVVVRCSSENVRRRDEPPIKPARPPKRIRGTKLERHDEQHQPLGERLVAHELHDLGVRLHDCCASRPVRFFSHQPEEVFRILWRSYMRHAIVS